MANLHIAPTLIFKVAIPSPIYKLFDYLPPAESAFRVLAPGTRLEVPFGKGKKTAFLVEITEYSDFPLEKLKPVIRILDQAPLLSANDMELLHWASRYYHHPLGEVISAAFPVSLRQGKPALRHIQKCYTLSASGEAMDSAQLKRAPKQKAMLEMFKMRKSILETDPQLAQPQARAIIKQLLAKNLVQIENAQECQQQAHLLNDAGWVCNPKQQAAITAVSGHLGAFAVFLLEGVTGSGKTEVYIRIIQNVLASGKQVLVLVPEITLTPQLETRFRERFSVNIAISHSQLSDSQRQNSWLLAQQGLCPILLGTRSTLFTPFKNLGLIILDEEHDSSFKQQEGFRFSARDVAVVRAKMLNIPVLLGSATPSLESLYNAERQRYRLLHLPERAGTASSPVLQLLDIRNKKMQEGLSAQLLEEISKTLEKQEQVLLFLNRRGFAPTLICHGCGWVARCKRCDANLVVHVHEQRLRCHHCGAEQTLNTACPACNGIQMTALGLGTERVEKVLSQLFPDKTIIRLDRDSTQRKGALETYLAQINTGQADIILGTQMLSKGHHFPNVTLVSILDADSGLFSIDFHAPEKLAQMVVQVAGRAGRAEKPGKVILQTRKPDHPMLTTLIHQGYNRFAKTALAEREQAGLPPYSFQALLRAHAKDTKIVQAFLQQVADVCRQQHGLDVHVLGPIPAPMAKRAGYYRHQLLFQTDNRPSLHILLDNVLAKIALLPQAKKVRWSLDVDPVDMC